MKQIKTIISLFALALLAACTMVNEPETGKAAINNNETAQVKVSIGGNARTILPTIPGGFSKFVLSADPGAGNTKSPPAPVEMEQGSWGYINVPYGDWIIKVTAYANVGGIDYAVVSGSKALTVYYSYHNVDIFVITPESGGQGTFTYTVRYPSTGSAKVKLESFPPGGSTPVINDETVSASGVGKSTPVASGIYFLTLTATNNGQSVIQNEIVHIYDKLTSYAEYTFTDTEEPESNFTADGFFYLGEFSDGERTWATNGIDGANNFTEDILASARYLIVKAHTSSLNGSGGLQLAHQGSGTNWDWKQISVTDGWTVLQPTLGGYGTEATFYIVIDLSTIPDWDKTSGGGAAKIILAYPVGWTDSNFEFRAGYLTSVFLTKPDTFVDVANNGTTYGWFALDVPEGR